MDFDTVTTYVLPHWPFVMMAFILGGVGGVMKKSVWTKERAARSRFFWWMRSLLPLHAPIAGALFGVVAELLGGAPVSPGVEGVAGAMLYHAGAGAASAWVYSIFRHFLKSRGIVAENLSMPPEPPG